MPSREWDVRLSASTGIFEGLETPDNFTWAATLGAGYTIHGDSVKVRIGVDMTGNSFDKDASGSFTAGNAPGVDPGGYFSPQLYTLEQLRVDVDWKPGEPTRLRVSCGAGPQNYRDATRDFSQMDVGLDIETRFDLRVSEEANLFLFYDYHDAGAAIHQNRFGFGVRLVF
jgi:hypothetical protein